MPQALISLGGNLGDVPRTFEAALERLARHPNVEAVRRSRIFATSPVGDHAGATFLNAAAALETSLAPLPLLDLLQRTEAALGRTRELHWGPRTLDLDLLAYDMEVVRHPRLTVPHPGCWYRRFVLDPLVEVASEVVHPEKGLTFARLRERLLVRPLKVSLAGGGERRADDVLTDLRATFAGIETSRWSPARVGSGDPTSPAPEAEPALIVWLGPDATTPEFSALPALPRLDVTPFPEGVEAAVRHVLQAATDAPHAV